MPKFINELNQKVNIFAEIGKGKKVGVGPGGKSEAAADNPTGSDELEFVGYDFKKEVKIIIEMGKLPCNTNGDSSKGEGFKYALGSKMGRTPHHIEVKRKGDDFTLVVHYNSDKEDFDPTIKHPN